MEFHPTSLLMKQSILLVLLSGDVRGLVQSVEYRKDEEGFYAEIYVWCED